MKCPECGSRTIHGDHGNLPSWMYVVCCTHCAWSTTKQRREQISHTKPVPGQLSLEGKVLTKDKVLADVPRPKAPDR